MGGVGAMGAVGGTGGTGGKVDNLGGTGGDEDAGEDCAATGAEAEVGREPADIIWVIDNSCSMSEEAMAVQTNMNAFAQQLLDNGIDVHLVLISSAKVAMQVTCAPFDFQCYINNAGAGGYGVCIDAPFGSGMCPMDSKAPNFLHIDKEVDSRNGLQDVIDQYPNYQHMLRPEASKHFVIVTDDEANMNAATFTTSVNALDPVLFAEWKFHGIFSFTNCASAASIGSVYQSLVTQTGGVAGDLCTQMFTPVFDELATGVVQSAQIACDWPIPAPPNGMTLDPDKVNVNFTKPDNSVVSLPKIPAGEDCGTREGWEYDNDTTPTKVVACPASCDIFQSTGGKVDVLFGCASIISLE